MKYAFLPANTLRSIIPEYILNKPERHLTLLLYVLLLSSCIEQFVPEINEKKELLVVEGLITDQPGTNKIKISKSLPMTEISRANPLSGCKVTISDDQGNVSSLKEDKPGTYITDSSSFVGVIGRSYTLEIYTYDNSHNYTYKTYPMEMIPVPPIDSIYYEKTVIKESFHNFFGIDGCHIYLNSHDPENKCKYYRWDYAETWVLRLLFPVPNMTCWISDNSKDINVKSTAAFGEARIIRHPVNYISNITDRLKTGYSILVNQYSLNEDEYVYWEKLQNLNVQVGGLYDIIPSSVQSNILCIENPNEKVLGYFSVSAKSSKRIFIKDNFSGIIDRYTKCITKTIYGDIDPPELNISLWTLIDHPPSFGSPRTRVLTDNKGCADCTVRGSNKKPAFWKDE